MAFLAVILTAPASWAATYGQTLGDARVKEIMRDAVREILPRLTSSHQAVFVTRDFEERVLKLLISLDASPSPEEGLRRGLAAFLEQYARFEASLPAPTLLSPANPRGGVRVKASGLDSKGFGAELVLDGVSEPLRQAPSASRKLVILQEKDLDSYLERQRCGEVPCQIPPCCGGCRPCKKH
jgi:hypothetical protein